MAKYSYEQRLEAVLNVVEKHMSIRESAKVLGTDTSPGIYIIPSSSPFSSEKMLK